MKKKLIFIVDDDEMMTQMLSDHLSANPVYKVSVFSTGEDCLDHLIDEPDVVILDYYLNAVHSEAEDGMKILEKIKKFDGRINVIMLSAQEHYGTALQTIAKGASEYIIKDNDAFQKIDAILESLE